jgi:hypothetical protein
MNNKPEKSKTDVLRVSCRRGGFALSTMLCGVVILLILGTALLSVGLHSRGFSVRTASDISARCAADSGLTKAFYEMNEKLKVTPWDGTSLPGVTSEILPNSDATYSYTVTGDLSSGYAVESTGQSGPRKKIVSCSLPLQGLFEYAIFGNEGIELKNGATIDWYNYDDDDKNLQVGTNSILEDSVVLMNGVTVSGDMVVGVGGNPDIVIDYTMATITGDTFAMTKEHDLPQVTVPVWLESMPSGGTIDDSIIISTSGQYDGIDLGNSKIITIDGTVSLYINGDIILSNSAELQVNNGDDISLILYVGGDIEVKNSGSLNNLSADPKKVQIFALDGCQNITLKNGSDFYGAIYAPYTDVVMMNSADFYGAIVAQSFEQKNSAPFNYDASLRDVTIDDIGICFVIQNWREE